MDEQVTESAQVTNRTLFAPAGRAEESAINELSGLAQKNPLVGVLLEAVNGFVLILNRQRQILAANHEVVEALGHTCQNPLVGFRPGEAFGCVHTASGPDGCGTAEVCSACGCVRTVLSCQQTNQPAEGECNLNMTRDGVLNSTEFKVRATPLNIQGHELIVAVLQDISDKKRRRVLERVLLHDMSNTIGALLGWSELMDCQDPREVAEQITTLARQVTAEFKAMRMVLEAERGDLRVMIRDVLIAKAMDNLKQTFAGHRAAQGKELIVFSSAESQTLRTDPLLLSHVLVNMTKNALEATEPGGKVRAWTEQRDGCIEFIVSNPGVIEPGIARQVFQRTFTTKSHGHGLGTYSMKLFGEQYLRGSISFSSCAETGTRFTLRLPVVAAENEAAANA